MPDQPVTQEAPDLAAGPFDTERQARTLPAVRAAYEASGRMSACNATMLEDACQSAGVHLGAFDQRILAWLAGFEPATCAVIASLITRAAGRSA